MCYDLITAKAITCFLNKCILPMAISEDNIDEDTFKTVKCSIDNVKIKSGMPADVDPAAMKKCLAPTLVLAAEVVISRFGPNPVKGFLLLLP